MYVIINSENGQYVYGTDFNYSSYRQREAEDCAIIFSTEEDVRREYKRRQCSNPYVMCEVELNIVNVLKS